MSFDPLSNLAPNDQEPLLTAGAVDLGAQQDAETGLLTQKYVTLAAARALSHAARHHGNASVLVIGLDDSNGCLATLGPEAASQIRLRLARTLAARLRQEDRFGHYGEDGFAVVASGTPGPLCQAFAERVREAISMARITVQGKAVALTASLGVASVPDDRVNSAGGWLDLAGARMESARAAGGNCVIAAPWVTKTASHDPLTVEAALNALSSGELERVKACLPDLVRQVKPLLLLMNEAWALDWPMATLDPFIDQDPQ